MNTYTYNHLDKVEQEFQPDRTLIEDFINAKKETKELQDRMDLLSKFTHKHRKLEKYLWTNQLGNTICILDISDEYLVNLTKYLIRSPRFALSDDTEKKINALKKEIERRGIKTDNYDLIDFNK